MKYANKKHYPIFTYLCCLLAVSAMFAGVTFSRYVGYTSGDTTATISRFAASYQIGDMSAATFSNVDYWLDIGNGQTAMNTARTVRFTLRNHTLSGGEVDRISDVDLQGTLRLYAPAEFVSNLAVQVVEVNADGGYIARTPQYVLGDLIYSGDSFASWQNGIWDTSLSADYNDRTDGGAADEKLTVNGGFVGTRESHSGSITAYCAETGNSLALTSSMAEASYSVGFYRSDAADQSKSAPQFYLDCVDEIPFYTLDISLADMLLPADGTAVSRTYVLFLTVVKKSYSQDFSVLWSDSFLSQRSFNGAEVVGYHFDRSADVYDLAGGVFEPTGQKTTIRVQKTFGNGGDSMSYYHVAPLSEGAPSLVHPLAEFFDAGGASVEASTEDVTHVHDLYGRCSNNGASGYISLADIPDSPYFNSYAAQSMPAAVNEFALDKVLSKGYQTRLNVLFVQASV